MSITLKRNVPFILCLTTAIGLAVCGVANSDAKPVPQQNPAPPQPSGPATDLLPKPTQDAGKSVQQAPPPVPVDPNAPIMVKPDPAELDLGEIPTMDTKAGTFKLVNTDTKPHTVKTVRPSCGCTTLKFVPDTVIPGGESLEIQVQLSGGPTEGPIQHKIVTIQVEGQPDVTLPLKGAAVAFVRMDPGVLDPALQADGKFKLTAKDGQAFRIMSMQPPIIEGFPDESKADHELTINWDKFRELGVNRRITFYLDHPKCQQSSGSVNWSQEDMTKFSKTPPTPPPPVPVPPPQPSIDEQLAGLIKDNKTAELLEKVKGGLDVNHRDSGGVSLLSQAAKAGNVELMGALLQSGADKELGDNVGRTPLMFAAQSKNPAAVRAMLDAGSSITARDSIGGTALSWASGLGDAQSVQELIDAGCDVEVVGLVTGWTPLIWAAGFGDPASIPILVKAHANIEAGDLLQGATPLINAARTGKVEGIKALVKAGAKLEAKDKNGKTAFLAACETSGGTADKVQALIESKANVHAKDNRGLNALQLARKRTDIRAPDVLKVLEPLLAAETPADEPAAAAAPAPAVLTPTAPPAKTDGNDHGH